jgi:hypothetical protein
MALTVIPLNFSSGSIASIPVPRLVRSTPKLLLVMVQRREPTRCAIGGQRSVSVLCQQ